MKRHEQRFLIGLLLLGLVSLSCSCGLISAFFTSGEVRETSRADIEKSGGLDAKELVMCSPEQTMENSGFSGSYNPAWNTEEYSMIDENRFLSAAANPYSTFGADVDTAGYSHVRRYLLQNQELPPQDAVRVEELINYFTYDYPEPEGDEPLSVTMEWADTPWNPDTKLFSVGLQAKKVDNSQRQPANLVFLIDVSGSMDEPNKLPLVQKAFQLLSENLSSQDRVSIVTYAGSSDVPCEGLSGSAKEELTAVLEGLFAGGGTHGSEGIETAYALAEKYFIPGGSNRVILATDGDLNLGVTSEGELVRLIEKKKESGVFLTVLGFGQGNIKDNKLEALADKGNGQYAVIDSVFEARRMLTEELGAQLSLIARDVKLQVEFNPELVKGYRLIGYENRLMAAEDFADDSKDGGEMGSGHRVTALYELVLKNSPMDIEEPGSRYRSGSEANTPDGASAAAGGEWLTVNIRYQPPEGGKSRLSVHPFTPGEKSEMSDNLKLASSVAAFGMKLRESPYIGEYRCSDILEELHSLKGRDAAVDELIYLLTVADKLMQDK